jgi:predicted amidohydrolase
MPLTDVIRAVTTTPRALLGADRPWRSADGTVQHATIFRVTTDPPGLAERAPADGPAEPAKHIVPRAIVAGGRYQALS